jgi:hypothetical protein
MLGLKDPEMIELVNLIKMVQTKMKEPDNTNLEYVQIYDKMAREFPDFSDRYPSIFTRVIQGKALDTLASAIFYQDKIRQGVYTETQLANTLADHYIPEEIRKKK